MRAMTSPREGSKTSISSDDEAGRSAPSMNSPRTGMVAGAVALAAAEVSPAEVLVLTGLLLV
jgi:hypothetical protein